MTVPTLSAEAFARLEVYSRIVSALEKTYNRDYAAATDVLEDLEREIQDAIKSEPPTVRILQICPAPAPMVDKIGDIYAGFALVEIGDEREILPFGSEGSIIGLPGELYYQAHALGDDRPEFARFADSNDDAFGAVA
jgi:hypothetical protein